MSTSRFRRARAEVIRCDPLSRVVHPSLYGPGPVAAAGWPCCSPIRTRAPTPFAGALS